MGSFFDFLKFKKKQLETIEVNSVHQPSPTEIKLNSHYILCGEVYRNTDKSIPSLEQFLALGFSVSDFAQYIHGVTQVDMQKRLHSSLKAEKLDRQSIMARRMAINAKKQSYKMSDTEIDELLKNGSPNAIHPAGMLSPIILASGGDLTDITM